MEFLNHPRPAEVEVHFKVSRDELESIITDISEGYSEGSHYTPTTELLDHLKSL